MTAPKGRRVNLRSEGTLVYRAYTADKRLIYVGMTDDIFQRMAAHRSGSEWWGFAEYLMVEEYPTRSQASIREAELVAMHAPRFNTALQGPKGRDRIKRRKTARECATRSCNGWAFEDRAHCLRCIDLENLRKPITI